MSVTFTEESTTVPIAGDQSVKLAPKQPWPSAYRGSRYSLIKDTDFNDRALLKWKQRDLSIFADPPKGLQRAMTLAGKSGGLGSFRVTARGEVLTKVEAENYSNLDQAAVSEGWIPVYLGTLSGEIDFGIVEANPDPPTDTATIWRGLPFNHGERWSVSQDGRLVWNWRDYRFESAFDHSELVARYSEYRPNPGRLYVTEHGHVWVNVPHNDVMPGKRAEVKDAIRTWKQDAEEQGDTVTLRLVNRRLVATSQTDDPADGHLPIHLGHLSKFDGSIVPRPVVDDDSYYAAVSQYEQAWG
jgi:hypothetical protein